MIILKSDESKRLFDFIQVMANDFSKEFSFTTLELMCVHARGDCIIMLYKRQLHAWEELLIDNRKPLIPIHDYYKTIQDMAYQWAKTEWLRYVSSPPVSFQSFASYAWGQSYYNLSLAFFREPVFELTLQHEKKTLSHNDLTPKTEPDIDNLAKMFRKELKNYLGRGPNKCYI